MPAAIVTVALLAVGFGLLWLSWKPHEFSVSRVVPSSVKAFWIFTEFSGWTFLGFAIRRALLG